MTGQIERIRVFLEVAERQSFAAAARSLGLTPSIVTRYVSELEAELSVQLLVRTTRRVSLTVAGRLYVERIRPVVDEIDRTNEFVRQQQDAVKGLLRVSAPLSMSGSLILKLALPQREPMSRRGFSASSFGLCSNK